MGIVDVLTALRDRVRAASACAGCILVCALVACGVDKGPGHSVSSRRHQPLQVAISEPVVVLSILARLAGTPPYKGDRSAYAATVDRAFAKFADHPAVRATRELAGRHSISYDAPMALAAYLDQHLRPIHPLRPLPPHLDDRWAHVDIGRYVRQVRSFADDADVAGFRRAHSAYFDGLTRRYRRFVKDQDIVGFYDKRFGPRPDDVYRVVPALLSNDYSFGLSAERRNGGDLVEPMVAPPPQIAYLAHEIAHSYVNDLLDPRKNDLRDAAVPLYRRVKAQMRRLAYTNFQIMVDESVVRAVTILYLRSEDDAAAVAAALRDDRNQGFKWTGTLADRVAAKHGRLDADTLVDAVNAEFAEQLG